jgi:hypothetical protein
VAADLDQIRVVARQVQLTLVAVVVEALEMLLHRAV